MAGKFIKLPTTFHRLCRSAKRNPRSDRSTRFPIEYVNLFVRSNNRDCRIIEAVSHSVFCVVRLGDFLQLPFINADNQEIPLAGIFAEAEQIRLAESRVQ